jgi:hypothetical protein
MLHFSLLKSSYKMSLYSFLNVSTRDLSASVIANSGFSGLALIYVGLEFTLSENAPSLQVVSSRIGAPLSYSLGSFPTQKSSSVQ